MIAFKPAVAVPSYLATAADGVPFAAMLGVSCSRAALAV